MNHLMVAGIDGSGAHSISVGNDSRFVQAAPAWSPDGKTILVPGPPGTVGAVDAVSGAVRVVGERGVIGPVRNVQWMPDGRSFVMEATDGIGTMSARQLWQVAYPSGERRRITNDVSGYDGVSLSADARLLATVQSSTQAKIWVVPAEDGEAREIGEGSFREPGTLGLSWTTDGRIVFTARSGGNHISSSRGRGGIWRIGIDGSDPRRLSGGGLPVPSPDGRFVYVTTGRRETMRIPADGGEPSQVDAALFSTDGVSPDGTELMGTALNEAQQRWECAILPTSGGTPRLLGDVPFAAGARPPTCRFDPRGTAIVYSAIRDGVMNVFARPLSGGAERSLTRFRRDAYPQMFAHAMSRDGRLAVSRGNTTRDVVLIAAK